VGGGCSGELESAAFLLRTRSATAEGCWSGQSGREEPCVAQGGSKDACVSSAFVVLRRRRGGRGWNQASTGKGGRPRGWGD
jgi:hypothetical protein